jgi:hypothetical protein
MTKGGQFIQAAVLLKEIFPEYKTEKLIRELGKFKDYNQNKILEKESTETEDIISKARKQAIDETIKEVAPTSKQPIGGIKAKLTPAQILANKIIAKTKVESKGKAISGTTTNPEQLLIQRLYKKYVDSAKFPVLHKEIDIYKIIQDITLKRELYQKIWNEAQEFAKTDKTVMNTYFYEYLEMLADPVQAETFMKQAVKDTLTDMGETVSSYAREYFFKGNESYNLFIDNLIAKMPELDTASQEYLRTYMLDTFREKMDSQRENAKTMLKKQWERRRTRKQEVESQEVTINKLMDIAYKDAFSIDEISQQWARKLGVMYISDDIKNDIYNTMRKIAQEPNQTMKDEMYDALISRMAKTVVSSPIDKATAIIRFTLLMKPKGLLRNMVTNLATAPIYTVAHKLENQIAQKIGVSQEDLIAGDKYSKFNKDTPLGRVVLNNTSAKDIERHMEKTSKYIIRKLLNKEVPLFKNARLNELMKMPTKALNEGEILGYKVPFLGDIDVYTMHFRTAMYNKLNAMKYSESLSEQQKNNMIEDAITFADETATKQVFRELNIFSEWILDFKKTIRGADKVAQLRLDGKNAEANSRERAGIVGEQVANSIYRFLITPAAIGAEVYRFSPVAIGTTLLFDNYLARKSGNWETSKQKAYYSKKISQALVGTATQFMVGIILAATGLLDAEPPEDDKERALWQLQGRRAWSIKLPYYGSVSIDWLQPIAGNIMLGASLWNGIVRALKDGISIDLIDKSISNLIDVFISISPASNLNRTFGNKYSSTAQSLIDFGTNTMYQFLPAGLVDFNKILDPYVRDSFSGTATQNVAYRLLSTVPFGSYKIPAKYDIWGRPIKSSKLSGFLGVGERTIVNFLSPFITTPSNMDNITREVIKVYNATSDKLGGKALPTAVTNRIERTYNGEKQVWDLKVEEYEELQRQVGQYAYTEIQNKMSSESYQKKTDEQKAKTLEDIYTTAKNKAKLAYIKSHPYGK